MPRSYTQSEVEEILRRALRATERPDELAHEDLLAAASEVGIEPATLDEAIRAVDRERALEDLEARALARKRRGFGQSLFAYLAVNGILAVLDLALGGGFWFHYVALVWALPLLFHFRRAFFPSEEERERAVDRERRRLERRERQLEKERRKRQLRASHTELESAIEAGVELFVNAISRSTGHARDKGAPRVRVEPKDRAEDVVTVERPELGRRGR